MQSPGQGSYTGGKIEEDFFTSEDPSVKQQRHCLSYLHNQQGLSTDHPCLPLL